MPKNANFLLRRILGLALIILAAAWFARLTSGIDFARLELVAAERYGQQTAQAVREWRAALERAGPTETDKLNAVNVFFNRRILFLDDQTVWGKSDYWATPLEVLWKGAGDCEDFAIAKYFSLKAIGISPDKLRLTYVKVRIGGPYSNMFQAHMVLVYYATPTAEPLILDNLITEIRPASRRPDLVPIFSFNSEGLWVAGSGPEPVASSTSRLSRWRDLLTRMQNDGYE
ncbi:MAG TPA: transglutaminase-like cysteine peptidase [Gallionella sp.]|nr:transglutaminase-like cysteine peptidase [Gallionella sp.]